MKIIFVCTGNTCRSPMAEVLAKDMFQKAGIDAQVISRGVSVYAPCGASENAKECAKEAGLSLDHHVATQITREDINEADLILTMTKGHKTALEDSCEKWNTPIFTIGEFIGKPDMAILDPFGGDLEIYRACFRQLKQCMEEIVPKLAK